MRPSELSDVERGDIDFAMNGPEITPSRQAMVRFSRPYYLYQLQLVTRQGEDRFTTLEECRDRGCTVATLGGSAADRLLGDLNVPKRTTRSRRGRTAMAWSWTFPSLPRLRLFNRM